MTKSITPSIGDILHVQVSSEERQWTTFPADGTPVTVRDFGRIYYGRTGNFGSRPGLYLNRCQLEVELPDGTTQHLSSSYVKGPNGEHVSATREDDRIGELPETPVWEEDIVSSAAYAGQELVVIGIDYKWVHGMDYARVSNALTGGWNTSLPINDLTLVRRGPVWAYYHPHTTEGQTILAALSEVELVNLHKRLGLTCEQRNPRTRDYSWTVSEALEDVHAGKVDAISAENGLFGGGTVLSIHRFDDRRVGELARKLTIAGWADVTPEKLAEYDRPHLERRERINATRKIDTATPGAAVLGGHPLS